MRRLKSSKGMVTGMLIVFVSIGVFLSGSAWAGSLEPSAPPGPTMKTLDEIPPTWSQILPASTRFVLVMGGAAVLDKETGLVWEQSPTTPQTFTWLNAQFHCNGLTVANRKGWRLPTVQELSSLVDPSVPLPGPTLPSGHPFSNVQSYNYWSATTLANFPDVAWVVNFSGGFVTNDDKSHGGCIWCVRGGQGVDPQ